ncbi:MAG: ORF6N domain-containing protein [Desulfovibrionaceae bacterium]|nr:ORF6N domain-containing protein [Desulfovibrionaceae bacterium]
MSTPEVQSPLVLEAVARRIFELRGQRVMIDEDLAILYGMPNKALLQAMKRNPAKFEDFVFQLFDEEWDSLRSQNVTSKHGKGGRRFAPYAFTEHGALMLSSVLNSERATEISRMIIRAFVWLRQTVPAYQELAAKMAELENAVGQHDEAIKTIVEALQELIVPPEPPRRKIGF